MLNFDFSEEQLMIRQAARDFAERELLPDVLERDEKAIPALRQIQLMGGLGFLGIMVDPKYQGVGMDSIAYILGVEEISRIDASVGVLMSVHNSLVNNPIEYFGTEAQKEKYLPSLARGESLGAFLLSEPEAGSDASMQRTLAIDKGDYYLVNGTKNWISNAGICDIYILIAHSHPEKKHHGINAFIVEKKTAGITLGPHEDKMGMRSSDTHSVMFSDVQIPKENRLGEDGGGFRIAMKALDSGRIGIAAQAIGIAMGAFERALKYAKERKAFGTEICHHQAIGFKLSDMAVKIETAQLLLLKAGWLKDQHKPYTVPSAMAKQYCADIAMEITTEAVQIHGGYGYVREYHVERLMREAKLTQIYEGTSEIQKLIISRGLVHE